MAGAAREAALGWETLPEAGANAHNILQLETFRDAFFGLYPPVNVGIPPCLTNFSGFSQIIHDNCGMHHRNPFVTVIAYLFRTDESGVFQDFHSFGPCAHRSLANVTRGECVVFFRSHFDNASAAMAAEQFYIHGRGILVLAYFFRGYQCQQ